MYALSQLVFGFGIGGEYPQTSTRATEESHEDHAKGQRHRGRKVMLSYTMQVRRHSCTPHPWLLLMMLLLLLLPHAPSAPQGPQGQAVLHPAGEASWLHPSPPCSCCCCCCCCCCTPVVAAQPANVV